MTKIFELIDFFLNLFSLFYLIFIFNVLLEPEDWILIRKNFLKLPEKMP